MAQLSMAWQRAAQPGGGMAGNVVSKIIIFAYVALLACARRASGAMRR